VITGGTVRKYIRQSTAAEALFVLPSDYPVASVSAVLYGPDGVADWAPAHTDAHPSWALSGAAAAGDTSISVSAWGTGVRIPEAGEELTLTQATTPGAGPTESVIVDRIDATTATKAHLRSPLRLAWASSSGVQPRILRVALATTDTATTGRLYRVEATVTLHATVPVAQRTVYPSPFLFDVVKHVPATTLSLARLREGHPNLFGVLSGDLTEEQSGVEVLLNRAFELVLVDLARRIKPDFVYSDADLEGPTIARMMLLMAEDGRLYPDDTDRRGVVKDARGEYGRAFDEALSCMGWVDLDDDQVPDENERGRSFVPHVMLGL
jgi:hypothetical protein